MYDALNRIESAFGDGIEYWDISFLKAWDNSTGNFGDGFIDKLFSALPENVSVGNPSFAKNSPYIITFDYLEDYYDIFGQVQTDYRILAANIESGTVNEIYGNNTVGYPSYSRLDDKILFTYDDSGTPLLATIGVQPDDKTLPVANSDVLLISGAQKGVWFQTGSRQLTAVHGVDRDGVVIFPQPAREYITVQTDPPGRPSVFRIMDMTGRQIIQGILKDNRINLHILAAGTYVLELQEANTVTRQILIKS